MSVGTNFNPGLPGELARFNREETYIKASRVYGSLPSDPVGGGRPAHWLPRVGLPELKAHVAAMAAVGIDFAYTINAPELFGSEEDPAWRDWLENYLSDLWDAGVRRLIVANHWLLRYLNERHEFSCTASLIRGVASPEDAMLVEKLGVDCACVCGHKVNRDIELLARIRAACSIELEVNVNMACQQDCRQARGHYRMLGHLSRTDRLVKAEDVVPADPFVLQCSLRLLADPTLHVLNALVPPGYLDKYAAAGADRFKITDRCSTTPSLLETLHVYASPEPAEDLFPAVLKGGSKLKLGLRSLFPADFIRDLPLPRLHIDGRRFVDERFIEREASMPVEEKRALARSLVTVEDPAYLERFFAFYTAVNKKLAGRTSVPKSELPDFLDLRRLLEPSHGSAKTASLTVSLSDCTAAAADSVGGKNASLGELMKAGLRVPPGFAVTTDAFALFVEEGGLAGVVHVELAGLEAGDIEGIESASSNIRAAMRSCPVPQRVRETVENAYEALSQDAGVEDVPVAVRSSATVEDQPGASLAGQLESSLFVRGLDAILHTIKECWSSLYTARALSYSLRQGLPLERARVSVGVQVMVDAEAAGVMFTLNPLNGDRSKIAIDANWGLGESVVKGEVTPDSFLVDKVVLELIKRNISDKTECCRAASTLDRVEKVEVESIKRSKPCLSDETVLELARLGKLIELHYEAPQDIEWAVARGQPHPENIYIVQSRPETVWSSRRRKPVYEGFRSTMDLILEHYLQEQENS